MAEPQPNGPAQAPGDLRSQRLLTGQTIVQEVSLTVWGNGEATLNFPQEEAVFYLLLERLRDLGKAKYAEAAQRLVQPAPSPLWSPPRPKP